MVASGHRGAYYRPPLAAGEFQYPLAAALFSVFLIAIEVALADRLLTRRSPRRLWHRALLGALVLLLPVSNWALRPFMHAPPYMDFHLLWLASLNVLFALLAIASGCRHMVSWVRTVRTSTWHRLRSSPARVGTRSSLSGTRLLGHRCRSTSVRGAPTTNSLEAPLRSVPCSCTFTHGFASSPIDLRCARGFHARPRRSFECACGAARSLVSSA